MRIRLQQRGHELRGIEHPEILALLAHPDEADGQVQFLRDGKQDAALGGAVELGDHQAGDADPFVKLLGLGHRVLADGAVEHQQHLVRRPGVQARQHAFDLLELVHEMHLGVQTPGGVRDQDIDVARLRGLQAVVDHRGGLGARGLRHDGHAVAGGPGLELLARRGAKGVAGRQHHAAPLGQQPVRELADGGGLAGAVDPHHQDDIGLDAGIDDERPLHRRENLHHGGVQGPEQGIHVVEFLARHAPPQLVEDAGGGGHADVGGDQAGLEVVENLGVDLAAGQQFADVGGEPRGTGVELGSQALEKTTDARFVIVRRIGGR